jgi:hypothetical protein
VAGDVEPAGLERRELARDDLDRRRLGLRLGAELGPVDLGPVDVRAVDRRRLVVGALDLGAVDLGPLDVRPLDVGPVDGRGLARLRLVIRPRFYSPRSR